MTDGAAAAVSAPARRVTQSHRWRGVLFVLSGAVLWSITAVLIQPLVTTYRMTPLTLATWRLALVSLALGSITVFRGPVRFRLTRAEIPYYVLYGVIGVSVFQVIWNASVQVNKAAVATALSFSAPAFVALAARFLFGERLGWAHIGAVALTLAGCGLVSGVRSPAELTRSLHGLELGLATGVLFATYALFGRGATRRWGRDAIVVLFYVFSFSALALIAAGLVSEGTRLLHPALPLRGWLLLLTLSFVPTLGGHTCFTISLRYLPAGVASLFSTLEPPLTALLAALILGAGISGAQWLGIASIVGGVFAAQAAALRGPPIPAIP